MADINIKQPLEWPPSFLYMHFFSISGYLVTLQGLSGWLNCGSCLVGTLVGAFPSAERVHRPLVNRRQQASIYIQLVLKVFLWKLSMIQCWYVCCMYHDADAALNVLFEIIIFALFQNVFIFSPIMTLKKE